MYGMVWYIELGGTKNEGDVVLASRSGLTPGMGCQYIVGQFISFLSGGNLVCSEMWLESQRTKLKHILSVF